MYFNEFDAFACEWLRNLFPEAVIDKRSIVDVVGSEITSRRCHFFGGIGGWELALRLAGWSDDWPVWTGSCPCQPFSSAGKRKAQKDSRHLWPEMFRLIKECRPPVIFGEQVSSADVVGTEGENALVEALCKEDWSTARRLLEKSGKLPDCTAEPVWIDGVRTDLEAENYSFWFQVLGAHSVGSPHIRKRTYWVAFANGERHNWRQGASLSRQSIQSVQAEASSNPVGLGDSSSQPGERNPGGLPSPKKRGGESREFNGNLDFRPEYAGPGVGSTSRLGDTIAYGLQGNGGFAEEPISEGRQGTNGHCSPTGFWSDFRIVHCTDGNARRFECGSFPLAPGIPRDMGRKESGVAGVVRSARRNRTGRVKGYGNSIVPELAAEFIKAFMEFACR